MSSQIALYIALAIAFIAITRYFWTEQWGRVEAIVIGGIIGYIFSHYHGVWRLIGKIFQMKGWDGADYEAIKQASLYMVNLAMAILVITIILAITEKKLGA